MLKQEIEHSEKAIAKLIHQIQADETLSVYNAPKKDYVKENFQSIQQLQLNALKKEKTKQPKESYAGKFSHVRSKVHTFHRKSSSAQPQAPSAKPHALQFDKENVGSVDVKKGAGAMSNLRNEQTSLMPKLELDMSTSPKENGKKERWVLSQPRNVSSAPNVQNSTIHKLGSIPKYLQERKAAAKHAKEVINDPFPGSRLLPEDERNAMLEKLKTHEAEILKSLASLPLRLNTHLQQRKRNIEEQLTKVEEGIRIFSRPQVFVKND